MIAYMIPVEGLECVPETNFYAKFKPFSDHVLEFEAWEAVAWGSENDQTVYFGTDAMNMDTEPTEERRYLRGHIKWDGCMNWSFQEDQGQCMTHHCSPDGVDAFCKLLTWLAEQGRRLPTWDENIGGRPAPSPSTEIPEARGGAE